MAGEGVIADALRERYLRVRNGNTPKWVFATQVNVGTGFSLRPWFDHERDWFRDDARLLSSSRWIDAMAINCWRTGKGERHAFEIKSSRGDLLRELNAPEKRQCAMALSTHFWFVLDVTVDHDQSEIPEDCGLMIHDSGTIRVIRAAQRRNATPPPYAFLLSFMRRLQLEESHS